MTLRNGTHAVRQLSVEIEREGERERCQGRAEALGSELHHHH